MTKEEKIAEVMELVEKYSEAEYDYCMCRISKDSMLVEYRLIESKLRELIKDDE